METTLQGLVAWYESLTPQSITRAAEFYAPDATFEDPFNAVQGVAAIERIFHHMFAQVSAPRFRVSGVYRGDDGAMLRWQFHFRRGKTPVVVEGCSHLRFDPKGQVCCHVDYWDPAKPLFMGLPVIGALLRALYRRVSAG